MIVVNTTQPPRPLGFAIPLPKSPTGASQNEIVCLKPGTNEIPDSAAECFEKSSTLQDWRSRRWIDIKEAKAGKDGKAPGLTGFAPDVATSLVSQCFDQKLLRKFGNSDPRPDVRTAISERIQELQKVQVEEE